MMADETISDRIRRLMQVRGETHKDAADVIDLDAPKFSKSLAGTRKFTSLEVALLADHYGVTVFYLLGVCDKCWDRAR